MTGRLVTQDYAAQMSGRMVTDYAAQMTRRLVTEIM
jgi:hypothetical protein